MTGSNIRYYLHCALHVVREIYNNNDETSDICGSGVRGEFINGILFLASEFVSPPVEHDWFIYQY